MAVRPQNIGTKVARLLVFLAMAACEPETTLTNFCPADVVINELAAAEKHDWIELYNADHEAVDLEGFSVTRSPDPSDEGFTIPAEFADALGNTVPSTLEVGGFLVLAADTYSPPDADEKPLVLGFDLNRDGGALWLRAPAENGYSTCDETIYPDQHDKFTWARQPDGAETWCDASEATEGTPNASCLCEGAAC